MAAESIKKKSKHKIENDIYTALLGLTAFVMLATAIYVCLRGMDLFDTFFKILD
ncbi:MAG: hypothetical protein JW860_05835 [Sedimentisphaerales bacterium]|nr:hypothetical protein [Sedimentisphaerales bacterium]